MREACAEHLLPVVVKLVCTGRERLPVANTTHWSVRQLYRNFCLLERLTEGVDNDEQEEEEEEEEEDEEEASNTKERSRSECAVVLRAGLKAAAFFGGSSSSSLATSGASGMAR